MVTPFDEDSDVRFGTVESPSRGYSGCGAEVDVTAHATGKNRKEEDENNRHGGRDERVISLAALGVSRHVDHERRHERFRNAAGIATQTTLFKDLRGVTRHYTTSRFRPRIRLGQPTECRVGTSGGAAVAVSGAASKRSPRNPARGANG